MAQPEADPQRQGAQHHRHHNRQCEKRWVVAKCWPDLHSGHAQIVHGTDASPDHHATADQSRPGQVVPGQEAERYPGGKQARSGGKRGNPGVIVHMGGHFKGQHANKMHGPDAKAQRGRTAEQVQALHVKGVAAARSGSQGQPQVGSAHRDQQRQHHQAIVVLARHQLVGLWIQNKEVIKRQQARFL